MADTMTTPKIEKFIRWSEKKVAVFTTDKVTKHYPKVGTEILLHPRTATKWVKKGYATKEAPDKATKKAK